ncbi:MAG: hypothetical protein WDM88_05730 [Galbitalea sp.]
MRPISAQDQLPARIAATAAMMAARHRRGPQPRKQRTPRRGVLPILLTRFIVLKEVGKRLIVVQALPQ